MSVVPEEIALRVLHGEQDFRYHQPIISGMTLVTRSAVIGVHGASSGVIVLGKGRTISKTVVRLIGVPRVRISPPPL
ncbi:MAG: FAS1-like dehydratase domain-containing protein [Solirubrobacteraceae bacterium]